MTHTTFQKKILAPLIVGILISGNDIAFALLTIDTTSPTDDAMEIAQYTGSSTYPTNAAFTSDMNGASNTGGSAELISGTASIVVPANISARADLAEYEDSVMRSEQAVREIDTESNGNTVSVWWKHEGTLLAFIPVSVESRTTVTANDDNTIKVTTEMPWWSVFVKGAHQVLVQTETNLQQSEDIKTHMRAGASAVSKAHVVHAIVSELASETQAQAYLDMESK